MPNMPKMPDAKEAPKDIEVVPIRNVDTFTKYRGQIAKLHKNVLGMPEMTDDEDNDGESEDTAADERDLRRLDSQYLPRSEKGEIFVVLRHGKVAAVVALRKSAGPQMSAEIEEFRLAKGKQKGVVKQGLLQIMDELRKEGIKKVNVPVEEAGESRFVKLHNENSHLKHFFKVHRNEHEKAVPKTPTASNDNFAMPEADNDNAAAGEMVA